MPFRRLQAMLAAPAREPVTNFESALMGGGGTPSGFDEDATIILSERADMVVASGSL